MRHTKPRFKLMARVAATKRRRKGVEFFAGLASSSFFYFKKRNPVEAKPRDEDARKARQPDD